MDAAGPALLLFTPFLESFGKGSGVLEYWSFEVIFIADLGVSQVRRKVCTDVSVEFLGSRSAMYVIIKGSSGDSLTSGRDARDLKKPRKIFVSPEISHPLR